MCNLEAHKHTYVCVCTYLLYVYVQTETMLCSKSFRVHYKIRKFFKYLKGDFFSF